MDKIDFYHVITLMRKSEGLHKSVRSTSTIPHLHLQGRILQNDKATNYTYHIHRGGDYMEDSPSAPRHIG